VHHSVDIREGWNAESRSRYLIVLENVFLSGVPDVVLSDSYVYDSRNANELLASVSSATNESQPVCPLFPLQSACCGASSRPPRGEMWENHMSLPPSHELISPGYHLIILSRVKCDRCRGIGLSTGFITPIQ
jgi:hypothetical protein